jgi:hypothetical protein
MVALARIAAPAPQMSRFAGNLLEMLDRVTYAPVDLSQLSDPVFKLRYQAYTREGFMPLNADEICTDEMDQAPNASCYGVHIDGELVSSLRIHHLTARHRLSPSMTIYSDILGPLLDAGQTFIDPTRFTADRDASLAYPALPFLTLRIAVMAAEYFKATSVLSSVRPEHTAFYRRVFQAEELGGVRYYPGLSFPCVMFASNRTDNLPAVLRRYPFFDSLPEERRALFAPEKRGQVHQMRPRSGAQAMADAVPVLDPR